MPNDNGVERGMVGTMLGLCIYVDACMRKAIGRVGIVRNVLGWCFGGSRFARWWGVGFIGEMRRYRYWCQAQAGQCEG
ncbi:hypothetical protein TIFTF001_028549 [Ficus carica]|uniref:Uncharacterized protein n=1 Tax=Ficus carica TaxID=3494 RepID=A0AA88DQ46_FICCA|nr:hypothetical protein TIFTF001_028549 [Ficus carica]